MYKPNIAGIVDLGTNFYSDRDLNL